MSNLASSSDFNTSFKPSNEKFEFSSDIDPPSSSLNITDKPSSMSIESSGVDNLSSNLLQSPVDAQLLNSATPANSAQISSSQMSSSVQTGTDASSAADIDQESTNDNQAATGSQQFPQEEVDAAIDIAAEALFTYHLNRDAAISLIEQKGYSTELATYVVDSVTEYAKDSNGNENANDTHSDYTNENLQAAIEIAANAIVNDLRDRETTVSILMQQGYSEALANRAVDYIYAQLMKDQPEALSEETYQSGAGLIVFGVILLLTGILLTAFSVGNAIWYGAIIVGIVEICRGIARSSNK